MPGVFAVGTSAVSEAIGINVGVEVNVGVGRGVKVVDGMAVPVSGTRVGVASVASGVGVE